MFSDNACIASAVDVLCVPRDFHSLMELRGAVPQHVFAGGGCCFS
jgi:hypothetical protein